MVAINHSEADMGRRAIHVQAKPIEHLDEAGFQRLRALWSNPPCGGDAQQVRAPRPR